MKCKKGQVSALQPIIISLVSVAIVLVIGFLIMSQVKTQIVSLGYSNGNHTVWNATNDTIDAMEDIPSWLPIIVIVMIGSLLIGLVAFFKGRG